MDNDLKVLYEQGIQRLAALGFGPTGLSIPPVMPIPDRVTVHNEIKVIKSKIQIAGRGIAVQCDVEDKERIFEIKEPLFTIVNNGVSTLTNTCDGCFEAKDEKSGLKTLPFKDLKFMACTGCRVTYYCSKECQAIAWKKHHKYECRCLAELKKLYFSFDSPCEEEYDPKPIHLALYRLLVRLLKMDEHGMVSEDQWAEIKTLNWDKSLTEQDKYFIGAKVIAEHIRRITGTQRSADLVLEVLLISAQNMFNMPLKLMRPWGKDYNWDSPFSVTAGRCFDPFLSMINHSCDPNVLCYFEGRKLIAIALEKISAGDEIFISYINYSNYKVRQRELKDTWGFTCTCCVCLIQRDTVGSLVFHKLIQDGTINLEDVHLTPKSAGERDEFHDILKFHRMLHFKNNWMNHHRNGNREEALRNSARMCFLGMTVFPQPSMFETMDTLSHMNHILGSREMVAHDIGFTHFKLGMRLRFLRVLDSLFTQDSNIVRHEAFESWYERHEWEETYGMDWLHFCHSERGKAEYEKHLRMFLDWAGLPLTNIDWL